MLERAYLWAAILSRSVLAFWNSAAPAKKYALVISAMHAIHTFVAPFRQVGVTYMRNLHFYYQVTRHAPQVILLFSEKIQIFCMCILREKYTTSVSADFFCSFWWNCELNQLKCRFVKFKAWAYLSVTWVACNLSSQSKIWSVLF